MKFLNVKYLIICLFITSGLYVYAVPASPFPVQITQPDGTTLTVILNGDEFYHYSTTKDGYLIKKSDRGIYNYATIDADGNMLDTRVKANDPSRRSSNEDSFVSRLPRNPSMQAINNLMRIRRASASATTDATTSPAKFPSAGTPRSLVILVNFSDLSFVTPSPNVSFTNLLNQQGYSTNNGTGSARDYFRDNSMGTFSPQFDVVGPFTLPQTYSFYGTNDKNGNDINPVQMVVDACKAADDNGVDFSKYDSDGDNLVDNVFIYYAGYNEAEHAPAETVWPHRWGIYPVVLYGGGNYYGTAASVTFDGKRVEDYACTSELKGKTGANMCGIGTFVHEFGHVIGLADMYVTDGKSKHQTLSYWDVMDAGPYLNSGITPPYYNAFERFSLGWMTPTEIKTPKKVSLGDIGTTNTSYIITQNGNHNLDGKNPSPTEFFMFENRQKKGWDTYLPGHGMLIYRINYNKTKWDYNTPNNDPNNMGVDILEADNIADGNTLSGDPFPGTANVTYFTPKMNNGIVLDKRINLISEVNGVISFNMMIIKIVSSFTTYSTVQGTPSAPQTISVSGSKLPSNFKISLRTGTHFQIKKETDPETAWSNTAISITTPADSVVPTTNIMVRYNPTEPSYQYTHNDNLVVSLKDMEDITTPIAGVSTRPVYVVPPIAYDAKEVTFKSFIASWEDATVPKDATGFYLTVYTVSPDGKTDMLIDNQWTTATSDTLHNLISDRDYFYKVKASDKNTVHEYENITEFSNTVKVHTLPYISDKVLRVVAHNGVIKVFVPSRDSVVDVFNPLGQKVKSIQAGTDILDITGLPSGGYVYIVQSGKYRAKVLL